MTLLLTVNSWQGILVILVAIVLFVITCKYDIND